MPESDASALKDDLYASPPVQRVARLLRRIAEGDAVTNMSRTARELGINRTTLLRLLHALESERFIEPRSEGEGWRIGVGLITLTAQAFFSEDLVQTAVPVLTRLAATTTLSAHLAVLDGHEIVYLVRRVPNHAFASNIRIGSRLPAHATNMGRSILANLPRDRVDRLYSGVRSAAGNAAHAGYAAAVAHPARCGSYAGSGLERRQLRGRHQLRGVGDLRCVQYAGRCH